jgi:hypothetical protein
MENLDSRPAVRGRPIQTVFSVPFLLIPKSKIKNPKFMASGARGNRSHH